MEGEEMERKPLKVSEVADLLRCSESLIYRLVSEGKIKANKLGTMIRIPYSEAVRIGAIDQ